MSTQLLWAKDIHDRLTSDELAKSVPDAERLLKLHHERKVILRNSMLTLFFFGPLCGFSVVFTKKATPLLSHPQN